MKTSLLLFCILLSRIGLQNEGDPIESLYRSGKDIPEILHLIDRAYVDQADVKKLAPGMFQGALSALDPNASYIPPGRFEPDVLSIAIRHTGIKAVISGQYGMVFSVEAASPAAAAGLRPGYLIGKVNGVSTNHMSRFQISQLLAESSQDLSLSIARSSGADWEELSITLKPFPLKLNSVERVDASTVRIQFSNWEPFTSDLLHGVDANGSDVLVLDFRGCWLDDPDIIRGLAAWFAQKGVVGRLSSGDGKTAPLIFENGEDGPFCHFPKIILLDETTSGSFEAFAAFAKLSGRFTLIGRQSQGLAGWYAFHRLENGGQIHIPVRRFEPLGSEVMQLKVTPDKLVPLERDRPLGTDEILAKALALSLELQQKKGL